MEVAIEVRWVPGKSWVAGWMSGGPWYSSRDTAAVMQQPRMLAGSRLACYWSRAMLNETVMSITLACHSPLPPLMPIHAHTCPYMLHMYIYYLCYNYVGRGSNHVRSCQQSKDMDQQFCHPQRVVQGHSPALLPRCPAAPLPRACVHYSRTLCS